MRVDTHKMNTDPTFFNLLELIKCVTTCFNCVLPVYILIIFIDFLWQLCQLISHIKVNRAKRPVSLSCHVKTPSTRFVSAGRSYTATIIVMYTVICVKLCRRDKIWVSRCIHIIYTQKNWLARITTWLQSSNVTMTVVAIIIIDGNTVNSTLTLYTTLLTPQSIPYNLSFSNVSYSNFKNSLQFWKSLFFIHCCFLYQVNS